MNLIASDMRRVFLGISLLLAILVLMACGGDDETGAKNSYVVGIVSPNPFAEETINSFKSAMAARNHIEGQNIAYFDGANAQELLKETPAGTIDLLLVVGGSFGGSPNNSLTQAKVLADGKIPIVTAPATGDPEAGGDVVSIAQPGKNITGLLLLDADAKRFDLFLGMLPEDAKTVAVIQDPANEGAIRAMPQIEALAQRRGLELLIFSTPAFEPAAAEQAFTDMPEDVGGIFLLKVWGSSLRWFDWAYEHRVPTSQDGRYIGSMPQPVMAYGPSSVEIGKQAANFADQILKGTKPGELPMQYTDAILIIDLGVADGMGVEVPDETVNLAQEIVHTDISVFAVQPGVKPVNVAHPAGTGACAAQQTSMGGSYQVCVSAACDVLLDSSVMRYGNKTDVGRCSERGLIGVCSTNTFEIHYYDGDPGVLPIGCSFQTGEWRLAGS